ncbi:hypothetical protein CMV_014869 [Castanea mollissima]|uniref:Cytochrome c oxidase subunit Vb n=1 Tax=Castanea mollissima TaxID=60419 RepID=A0A8J4VTG5_9ROSI|nr:hypothetical protein CMV_014869 [Castanea mollissima]
MWRRLLSSNLKTLAAARSTPIHTRSLISPYASASLFNLRHFTADSAEEEGDNFFHFLRPDFLYNINGDEVDERVEDENDMPIVNYPGYGFGTKEEPAIIESFYDKGIAGCFGGESRLKHDFVCFWLKKGKPRKCPVCPQYFELKVVGPGGLPDGQRAGIKFREITRQFPEYTTAFRIQKLCVLFVFDWSLVFVDVAFATFEIEPYCDYIDTGWVICWNY